MREAFTNRLRAALDTAQDEARALNQEFVGVEHLLLGLLGGPGDAEAVEGLKLAGVVLPELRQKLIDALPSAGESPGVTGALPLSPKAQRAVNAALVKAQTTGGARVTSRLVLLSLLEECEAGVTKALRDSGADLDHLRQLLVQDGQIHPED